MLLSLVDFAGWPCRQGLPVKSSLLRFPLQHRFPLFLFAQVAPLDAVLFQPVFKANFWCAHRRALGCFPNAPVTRCISEKFRVAIRPMRGAAVSPPGRRHTFRVRCSSPAGLHGLASSHMGSPAGSRACMGIEVCVSRYARFRGSIREDS